MRPIKCSTDPTLVPSTKPSIVPSIKPSVTPSFKLTSLPSKKPTVKPSLQPVFSPTPKPTIKWNLGNLNTVSDNNQTNTGLSSAAYYGIIISMVLIILILIGLLITYYGFYKKCKKQINIAKVYCVHEGEQKSHWCRLLNMISCDI